MSDPLKAGRELDGEVAVKVMEYRKEPLDPKQYQRRELERLTQTGRGFIYFPKGKDGGSYFPPPFSTDYAEACRVLEWLRQQRTNVSVSAANGWGAHAWDVVVDETTNEMNDSKDLVSGYGDTMQLAICACALKVYEYDARVAMQAALTEFGKSE